MERGGKQASNKRNAETKIETHRRSKENLKEPQEYTSGLVLEVFMDVMVTSERINKCYKKLFPNAPNNQTYEEMWKNTKALRNRQET